MVVAAANQRTVDLRGRRAVRAEEAARLLGVSRSLVFKTIAAGGIGAFRVGRSLRIPLSEIERLLGEPLGAAAEGGDGGSSLPERHTAVGGESFAPLPHPEADPEAA